LVFSKIVGSPSFLETWSARNHVLNAWLDPMRRWQVWQWHRYDMAGSPTTV
jgi:hypothetical protein